MIVERDNVEIGHYQETELGLCDWAPVNDNDEMLLMLGWDDDDIDSQDKAREKEVNFIALLSELIK